jgi:glycerophosphoryl diester phosphodiesterase
VRRSPGTVAAVRPRLLALVAVAALVAGCGSSRSSSPTTTGTAPGSTVASTAATSTSTVAPSATRSTAAPTTAAPSTTTTGAPTSATTAGPRPAPSVADLLALGRPVALAHAGGDDSYPHSTPFAFASSVAVGTDVLDMDVQLSADGVLVVQHDDTVDRTTDGTGKVADKTYAELRALDNAYWWAATCTCRDQPASAYTLRGVRTGKTPAPPGFTPEDFVIPTFDEIARRFPSLPFNIEIKGTYPDALPAARALAAALKATGRERSTVVTSFDDQVVAAFHDLAPAVELTPGLQVSAQFVLAGTVTPGFRIYQLPPDYQGTAVVTPELIRRLKAAGLVLWMWPNGEGEDEAGYRRWLDLGVDGINAANPPALARLLPVTPRPAS